ncbi:hypothetical protein WJX84_003095 [Apatococcus fuscideae]|uniref:Uncharacterized protein n=1 Tax=Apatococcus fuscideae TaxID=2026836 RepID=A0AAW1SVN3_9CHLO
MSARDMTAFKQFLNICLHTFWDHHPGLRREQVERRLYDLWMSLTAEEKEAFRIFCQASRVDFEANHPAATATDIGRHQAAAWRAMGAAEREPHKLRSKALFASTSPLLMQKSRLRLRDQHNALTMTRLPVEEQREAVQFPLLPQTSSLTVVLSRQMSSRQRLMNRFHSRIQQPRLQEMHDSITQYLLEKIRGTQIGSGKTALGMHLLPAMRNKVIAARAKQPTIFPHSASLLAEDVVVSHINFNGSHETSDTISGHDIGLSGEEVIAERILARAVYGVGVNTLRTWLRPHAVPTYCLTLGSVFAFIKQKKAKGMLLWNIEASQDIAL